MLTQRQRSRKLRKYRAQQAIIAFARDGMMCRRCGAAGVDVHHVRGRGNWRTREEYESFRNLVTLCRDCHARCHHVAPLIPKQEIIEILERVLQEVT